MNLLEEYKIQNSLSKFKEKIKNWKCEKCVSQLCSTYDQNFGFNLNFLLFQSFFSQKISGKTEKFSIYKSFYLNY